MTTQKSLQTSVPLVSICCATYNHEKFIRDAIESFLMQEVDFPLEIIIHDDASTDGTAAIIREYADKYPDLIVPVFQTVNQYTQGRRPFANFLYPRARGKYIALCEGDDYWTDPKKLQIQVDYMEAHPECRLCFHSVRFVSEHDPDFSVVHRPPQRAVNSESNRVDIREWLRQPFISTATAFFRPAGALPKWYIDNDASGDWPLFLWLLLEGGELHYIDCENPMTTYRRHSGGVSSGVHMSTNLEYKEQTLLKILNGVYEIKRQIQGKHRRLLDERLYLQHHRMAVFYLEQKKDLAKARVHALRALRYANWNAHYHRKKTLKVLIRTYPSAYRVLKRVSDKVRSPIASKLASSA